MDNFKHNKKRNTAFVYEALTRELTKAIVKKDSNRKEIVFSILREHFKSGTVLRQELDLYKTVLATGIDKDTATQYLSEAKLRHTNIDKQQLFNEQTKLINKINMALAPTFFDTFVPNYKNLATVYQIFHNSTNIKEKIILEQKVIGLMTEQETAKKEMQSVDALVVKTFLKKYNEKYATALLEEQKMLMNQYVMSFAGDGLSFKIYLNEEIARLKDTMTECMNLEEVKSDEFMLNKSKEVMMFLESFRSHKLEEMMTTKNIESLMQIQNFVREAQKND